MLKLFRWSCAVIISGCVIFAMWLLTGLLRPLDPIPFFGVAERKVAITNVTIIDVEKGATIPQQTVMIENGKISKIGPVSSPVVPGEFSRIDGSGKFLAPGLWDAHTHSLAQSTRLHFPLLVAHGVTSVRNMGDGCSWSTDLDCVPDHVEWARQGEAARALVPHIADISTFHFEEAVSKADADRILKKLKQRGDTIAKLQLPDDINPDEMAILVEQAKRAGLPIAGHVPKTADLTNQQLPAYTSIEHGDQLLDQCDMLSKRHAGFDKACTPLLRKLAGDGTAFVPTFVASTGQEVTLGSRSEREASHLRYAASPIAFIWRSYRTLHSAGMDSEARSKAQERHRSAQQLALLAKRTGVMVLAGTDSMDPFVLHGTSLHDELEMLVAAGFTPAETLRAATWTPANFDRSQATRGKIALGYDADMLLLADNPLKSIGAVRQIEVVFARGRMYDQQAISQLKNFTERQASSHALNARLWWALLFG